MGRPHQQQRAAKTTAKQSPFSATLKDVLTNIYSEIFLNQSSLPLNAFSVALKAYMNEKAPHLQYGEEEMKEQQPCPAGVYDALMPMLVKEVIETCKYKFSNLGQSPTSNKRPSYLAVSLARDETIHFEASIDSRAKEGVEVFLEDVEYYRLFQAWSKIHPLSLCISMSQGLGTTSLSKALRGIIASEALVMTGARGERSDQLLKQAQQQFCDTRLPKSNYKQTLLYACQVSTLLSWNSIAHTKVKKGVTFLALSCQLMAQLQNETSSLTVEEQVSLENLSAFLSLITIWSFSQLDQSSGYLSGSIVAGVQSNQARFFCNVSQMSSLLLDSHPDLYLINNESATQNINFITLCDHLRLALQTIPLDNKDDGASTQLLTAAVREILIISLLVPRSIQDPLLVGARVEELLSRCSNSLSLLENIANEVQDHSANNHHLLSKVTYQRLTPKAGEEMEIAWKGTLASILFETLTEAIQAMCNTTLSTRSKSVALRLIELSESLSKTPTTLIVETPASRQKRESLTECNNTLKSITAIEGEELTHWLEEGMLPTKIVEAPLEWDSVEAVVDNEVFNSLWGQLQWDFQSDLSSFTPSPNSIGTQST